MELVILLKNVGSFESDSPNIGGEVSADYYTPTAGGDSNCRCTPNYTYSCVSDTITGTCDGRCGLTVSQTSHLVKTDTACFPNQPLTVTNQERIDHPCPEVQGQCPTCGAVSGETDVVNEVN